MADIAFSSVGKIIQVAGKIKEAVATVKQNREECEDIKSCVTRVEEILEQLDQTGMNQAMSGTLDDLAKSVDNALELVNKCQQKHIISHLWSANSMAKKLNKVHEDIWRKLQMGNFATHVSVYKTLHPQDAGAGTNSNGESTSYVRLEVVKSQKGKMAVATISRAQSDPVADSKSTPARDKKPKYNILTRDRLLTLLKQERLEIARDLNVPEGVAELLLHRYDWSPVTVRQKWSTKHEEVCKAVGLRSSDERPISMKLSAGFGICKSCGEDLRNRMSPGSCEHYYCESCWRDYLSKQMRGPDRMCLSMRCPDPSCQAPIVRELVEKMADKADKDLYDTHVLHSWYPEKMAYAGRIYWKWCPLDCGHAIEFLGDGLLDDGADVVCACGHNFCLNCGGQAHQPLSCETMRAIEDKTDSSKSIPVPDKKPKYNILTRDRLLTLLKQERLEIARDLNVPEGVAELLLCRYDWSPVTVRKKWSANREAVCKAIGLRSSDERPMQGLGTCKLCSKELVNRISPGSCGHYYCESCWRDYFKRLVRGPGRTCLNMRCPDPSCQVPVFRELVEKMSDDADKDLYDTHVLRSWYPEKMAYAGRMYWKWCPLDCGRAIEFLGDGLLDDGADVVCDCGHGFCLNCGRQAHQPKSCDTMRAIENV